MSRKRGLMDRLNAEDLVKAKETPNASSLIINQQKQPEVEEFEKKRQTIYLKENLIHSIKYKAFIENTSMTDIFNDLLESHLSEEELQIGVERARE